MSTETSTPETVQDDFDLIDVMERIRARAEERRAKSLLDTSAILARLLTNGNDADSTILAGAPITNGFQLEPDLEKNDHYSVKDFLRFNDRAFIRNAYRAILKREPDDTGYKEFVDALRSGRLNKVDILAKLRFSSEGEARKVTVYGLGTQAHLRKLYRLPVIGYLLEMIVAVVQLPSLIRQQRRLEAHAAEQDDRLMVYISETRDRFQRQSEDTARDFSSHVAELREAQRQLAQLNQQQIKGLVREQRELTEDQNRLKRDILNFQSATENQFAAHKLTDEIQLEKRQELQEFVENEVVQKLRRTRAELVLQERRLLALAERRSATSSTQSAKEAAEVTDDLMDLLYVALEDQFRGTRADIKEAFQVYLPFLNAANITQEVLDVGCGRGEWLELLRDEGIAASGVEINKIAIKQCLESQLEVTEAEALSHLAGLRPDSLNCVTAFHVVEHLPLKTLVRFVDESLRVLRPGGLLIIETPNPENLIVGSCNFYFDPTHRNPLPRLTMECILESRGFGRLEAIELRPMLAEKLKGADELTKRFNEHFYGPMDYAIVARKV